MKIPMTSLKVAKVVGENDDGLTLFVPKNDDGTFDIEEGDQFLTILFVRQEDGAVVIWTPWDQP